MAAEANLKKEEPIQLWGPSGSFVPEIVNPAERDVEALRLFQSFLCNSGEEREGLSNVIVLWEQIPKFSAEHVNSRTDVVPLDYKTDFLIAGHTFNLTLFPGTYYPDKRMSNPLHRYPGAREQSVEQALIQLACAQAESHEINGETFYRVRFTTRELARVLKSIGSSMSNGQIRECLEVLSSTTMTIRSKNESGNQHETRQALLPSFQRILYEGDPNSAGKDVWSAQLHPLVSDAIRNVAYRQYPIAHTIGFPGFAAYLIRQMHYIAPNISPDHPFTFRLNALAKVTPGLNLSTIRASIKALTRELNKMMDQGLLTSFECNEIFAIQRKSGRPAPIDAEFMLMPGSDWIKNVKSGSRRLGETERSLGLARSKRTDRQMHLNLT